MPSLGMAAAAAGWCPVCHQTRHKHTAECSEVKRKKHWRKMYWIIFLAYSPFILLVLYEIIFGG